MYVEAFGGYSGNEQFKSQLKRPVAIINHNAPRLVAEQYTRILLSGSVTNSTSVTPKQRDRIIKRLAEIFRKEPGSCEVASKLCILFQENGKRSVGQVEKTDALLCKLQHLCMHETPNQRFQNHIRNFIGPNQGQELNDIQIAYHLCHILHEYMKLANDMNIKSLPTFIEIDHSQSDLKAEKPVAEVDASKHTKKPRNFQKRSLTAKKKLVKPHHLNVAPRFHLENPSITYSEKSDIRAPKQVSAVNYNSKPMSRIYNPMLRLHAKTRQDIKQIFHHRTQGYDLRNSEMDNESVTEQMQALDAIKQKKKQQAKQRQARKKRLKNAIDASVEASIRMMFPKIGRKCQKIVNCVKEENLKKYGIKEVCVDCKRNGVKLLVPQKGKKYIAISKPIKKTIIRKNIEHDYSYKYNDYLLSGGNPLLPFPNIDERIGEAIGKTTKKRILKKSGQLNLGFDHHSNVSNKKAFNLYNKIKQLKSWEGFY